MKTTFLIKKIKFWFLIVQRGGPIRDSVKICNLDDIIKLWRKATDPEMQEVVKNTWLKKYSKNDEWIN